MVRVRRIIKAAVIFLISLAGFLLLVFIFINLPVSHRFVTQKVNNIFYSSGIPVHINSVNKVFPWSVYVQGVLIHSSSGDTIVYAGKVRSGFKSLGLLRKRIILPSVDLENTSVNFTRNSPEEQLNIAEAFSQGKVTKPENQDTNKSPWEISLGGADVKNLRFRMTDSVAGIYVSQDIKKIKIETKKMSLPEKTILVKSIGIEGATGNLTLSQTKTADKSESGSAWIFGLEEFEAENLNIVYEDPVNKMRLDLLAGEIRIDARNTDINRKIIDIDQVSVSRANIVLRMDNKVKTPVNRPTADTGYFAWDIRGDLINLEDVACRISNYTYNSEYNPLSAFSIIGLGMRLSDLQINKTAVEAGIADLKFDLGNGFSMKKLNGKIRSHSGTTRFDLGIETAYSSVNLEGLADRIIWDILKNPAEMNKANLSVSKADVSLTDIFYFKPDLQKIPGINTLVSKPVSVEGDLKIDGTTFILPSLSIYQANSTRILLEGKINNIFIPKEASCDLKIRIKEIDNDWLSRLLPEVLPGFRVPNYKVLTVTAIISDSLRSPDFSLKFLSDLGKIDLVGSFDFVHDKFSVKSNIDKLMLGTILNNPIFGSLKGSGEINGSGIKGKLLNAEAVFMVDSLGFKDYIYTHAGIDCIIQPGKYFLKLNINDPSLAVDIDARATTAGSELSVSANGKVLADLYNLHFIKDSVILESLITADIRKHAEETDAGLMLSEIKIATPHDSVAIHKIVSSLKSDSLTTNFVSDADFFSMSAHIDEPVKGLEQFLQSYSDYIRSLINPSNAESVRHHLKLPLMTGKIKVNNNDILKIFIPDTTLYFRNLSFAFNTNVADNKVIYALTGRSLRYKLIEIGDLSANLADSAATLDWNIIADTCLIAEQPIRRIHLASHFSDWKSLTTLSVIDNQSRLNYNFEIRSVKDTNTIILELPSRQLILNSVRWLVDSSEFLRFNIKKKFFSPSFRMHTDSSFISLLRDEQDSWQKYDLRLNNVALSSIIKSELLPGKPRFMISGSYIYSRNAGLGKKLTADLQFSDVSWSDLGYKKISLKGSFLSDTKGNFNYDLNAHLDTSEIVIRGQKPDKSNRNINAQFKMIPVNTIQPFVKKYLSDLRGTISGEFAISIK
jgi:hypothetical protein